MSRPGQSPSCSVAKVKLSFDLRRELHDAKQELVRRCFCLTRYSGDPNTTCDQILNGQKYLRQQWNVMPLIRRGSNFYFFAALYFALLDLLPCLQARGMRDCNKGSKSSRAK